MGSIDEDSLYVFGSLLLFDGLKDLYNVNYQLPFFAKEDRTNYSNISAPHP